jgi:hypothetical protein
MMMGESEGSVKHTITRVLGLIMVWKLVPQVAAMR